MTLITCGEDAAVGGELYFQQVRMHNFSGGVERTLWMWIWWGLVAESCEGEILGMCSEDGENCITLYAPIQPIYLTDLAAVCSGHSRRKSKDTRRKCRGETSEIPASLQARWRVFTRITSTSRIVERHLHYKNNMVQ